MVTHILHTISKGVLRRYFYEEAKKMFRVRLQLAVAGRNGTGFLSRWIDLPFAPFVGLKPLEDDSEIQDVRWSIKDNCFVCGLEMDDFHSEDDIDEALKGWVEFGFSMDEVDRRSLAPRSNRG